MHFSEIFWDGRPGRTKLTSYRNSIHITSKWTVCRQLCDTNAKAYQLNDRWNCRPWNLAHTWYRCKWAHYTVANATMWFDSLSLLGKVRRICVISEEASEIEKVYLWCKKRIDKGINNSQYPCPLAGVLSIIEVAHKSDLSACAFLLILLAALELSARFDLPQAFIMQWNSICCKLSCPLLQCLSKSQIGEFR